MTVYAHNHQPGEPCNALSCPVARGHSGSPVAGRPVTEVWPPPPPKAVHVRCDRCGTEAVTIPGLACGRTNPPPDQPVICGGTYREGKTITPVDGPPLPECLVPGCRATRRTRGICHQHYQVMRDRVRKGRASEADLEARGLLLPKGTGGVPLPKGTHDIWDQGSTVRGDG